MHRSSLWWQWRRVGNKLRDRVIVAEMDCWMLCWWEVGGDSTTRVARPSSSQMLASWTSPGEIFRRANYTSPAAAEEEDSPPTTEQLDVPSRRTAVFWGWSLILIADIDEKTRFKWPGVDNYYSGSAGQVKDSLGQRRQRTLYLWTGWHEEHLKPRA